MNKIIPQIESRLDIKLSKEDLYDVVLSQKEDEMSEELERLNQLKNKKKEEIIALTKKVNISFDKFISTKISTAGKKLLKQGFTLNSNDKAKMEFTKTTNRYYNDDENIEKKITLNLYDENHLEQVKDPRRVRKYSKDYVITVNHTTNVNWNIQYFHKDFQGCIEQPVQCKFPAKLRREVDKIIPLRVEVLKLKEKISHLTRDLICLPFDKRSKAKMIKKIIESNSEVKKLLID